MDGMGAGGADRRGRNASGGRGTRSQNPTAEVLKSLRLDRPSLERNELEVTLAGKYKDEEALQVGMGGAEAHWMGNFLAVDGWRAGRVGVGVES